MNLVFSEVGHLLTAHRGSRICSLAWISCYVTLIPHGVINYGGDKPRCIQSERFMADWLKSKGLHKLCSVFEGIQEPFVLSSAYKRVVY